MCSIALATLALVGLVSANTPPGYLPSTTGELTITFGNTLAANGVDLPKDLTQQQPTVGTATQLSGTYSIVMVDPDIPRAANGSSRGEFLHWMQTNLVSSPTATVVGGRSIFPMVTTTTAAIAPYRGPAPPAAFPFSHRYILLVVNTTGNQAALTALNTVGQTRLPFNAQSAMQAAGLTVLAGGWFNVTNTSSTTPTGVTSGTGANPTGTGTPLAGAADALACPGMLVTGLGLFIGWLL